MMSQSTYSSAAKARLRRASHRLASVSWRGESLLSDIALQTMTASISASMLLMAAACAMHVITLTLIRADTLLR
jgi:hypothetical protein